MPKQKIEIEVDIPEGYEATGEFRRAKDNEIYLGGNGQVLQCQISIACNKAALILRKKELRGVEYLQSLKVGTLFSEDRGPYLITAEGIAFTSGSTLTWAEIKDVGRFGYSSPSNSQILYTPEG